MLVPLIKLFLELDAKDVAKYWDSAAQPQPLVAAENLIHRHLSLVGYVARGIYSNFNNLSSGRAHERGCISLLHAASTADDGDLFKGCTLLMV